MSKNLEGWQFEFFLCPIIIFIIREWMVPSFIMVGQAAQILATGKSVVFLREARAVDHEHPPPAHAHLLDQLLRQHTGNAGIYNL